MRKIWMSSVFFCTLIFICSQSYAEGCGAITTWNSGDAAFFTSNQGTVYSFENTPFPIPNLGEALVTSIDIHLANGPAIRIWSHEDDGAAQTSLTNYLALKPWSASNLHTYGDYNLVYELDDHGMVKVVDLIANYRGNLIEMLSYFFEDRSLSGELPVYDLWFSQVKALIDSKCSGSCGAGKIPLPEGVQAFDHTYEEEISAPVSGCNPETIRPLALEGSNFHIKLCPFEQPVDIFVGAMDSVSAWIYLLDEQQHPVSLSTEKPFMRHVTGAIDILIPNRFGGLWGDKVLTSKGEHNILLGVVPSGGDFSNMYLWQESTLTECKNKIPLPTSRQFFFDDPRPAAVSGTELEEIKPFGVGAYAVGEDLINFHYEFCPFEAPVDIHVALYCPDSDLLNVYFLVNRDIEITSPEQVTEDLFFEKVSINHLDTFPQPCWRDDTWFDEWQEDPSSFFVGLASQVPAGNCFYMVAVTPKDVRDRYYAWVTHVDLNLKDAIIKMYRLLWASKKS